MLDVSDVRLGAGVNIQDFQITGDGCTVNVVQAGSGCVLNVRFAPTAVGSRSAALRVTSNAANSPIDIVLAGDASPPPDTTPPAQRDGAPVQL